MVGGDRHVGPKLPLDRFREIGWNGLTSEREEHPVATRTVTTATTEAERELRVAEVIAAARWRACW